MGAEGLQGGACVPTATDGWCRYFAAVTVPRSGPVTVAVMPDPAAPTVVGDVVTGAQTVELAGFQLEDVTRVVNTAAYSSSTVRPTAFIETDGAALTQLPVCEDTDGNVFRQGWRYDCERLCSSGIRTDCPDESAVHVCFWEHKFQINPEELRSTGRLAAAGFALGNFNYRVERVGLNFVGTSVRDCTEDQFPSSCYGSGFVNYSIEHGPPYPVTNHAGDQYLAPLFTGRIEYARALAAERYLTNPLSSADRALIEPYSRGELRGRPLTGAYTVRIWDDGVVNFDRIEDVQILLDYRYWTRFH